MTNTKSVDRLWPLSQSVTFWIALMVALYLGVAIGFYAAHGGLL